MVTMSDVWDSTTEIVDDRTGAIAVVATLTGFVPAAIYAAVPLAVVPGTTGFALAGGSIAIAAAAIALWGRLALRAIGIEPRIPVGHATRRAGGRFAAAVTATIVVAFAVLLALMPFGIAAGLSGIGAAALEAGATGMPSMSPGTATFVLVYSVLLVIAAAAIGARLILVYPVVLNERRGLGAFRRSWTLTRGIAWRIIGTVSLYVLALIVGAAAAQFAVGAVAGVLFDDPAVAGFLGTVARAAVTTVFSVYAAVFTARLYVALVARDAPGATP